MKIATITFHRAQNFGSVLQSYALQQFVIQCGETCGTPIQYQIIDLTTEAQRDLYSIFKPSLQFGDLAKNIVNLVYAKAMFTRQKKFENFLHRELSLTPTFFTEKEACKGLQHVDCLISGSDQLWNVRARDCADFYYLNFMPDVRKISYAASFGPLFIDWKQYDSEKYTRFLEDYSCISVREKGSAKNVRQLTNKNCEIHVDPTLLLSANEWRKLQSDATYNDGKYILLYCLEPSRKQLQMVRAISKKFKLPIVALRYNNKHDMFNSYVKRYDAGPKDFLAYIDHAAMVVTSSFHGTAFSIIYRKPFCVLNGMRDKRIANILEETGLTNHSIDSLDEIDSVSLKAPDKSSIHSYLSHEKQRSFEYLKQSIPL